MAVESKRGCGYRKVGGIYMVSGKLSGPCGRLPIELHVCPTCNGGIKQTRSWQWVRPAPLLAAAPPCGLLERGFAHDSLGCLACPAGDVTRLGDRAGLLWVGGSFYPEVEDFMREARAMGVSKRIHAVPRDFKLGLHYVLIAHPKAVERVPATEEERIELLTENAERADADEPQRLMLVRKGIITLFKPTAIEKIVTETQAKDEAEMATLAARHITPVVVPDNDPDHQGTVYDAPPEQINLPAGFAGVSGEHPGAAP